jgi:hypothetical protein
MKRALGAWMILVAIGCGPDGTPDAGSVDAATDAAARDDGGGTLDGSAHDASSHDASAPDASIPDASTRDASMPDASTADGSLNDAGGDGGAPDASGGGADAGIDSDAGAETDAGVTRAVLWPTFCPSTATPAGLYRGTLSSNFNEHSSACGLSAPGRDGFVRVEVAPGQTLRAVYRHAGDGVLYLLDNCPVLSSCLDQSDGSSSGPEQIEWTNTGAATNPVYLGLDAAELGGPATFELDIHLTP